MDFQKLMNNTQRFGFIKNKILLNIILTLRSFYFKFFKRPKKRIKILFAYIKQGWNTYDWDWAYLMSDIEFKIKRIQKEIKTNHIVASASKQVKEMEEVLVLIDRFLNFDYDEKYLKPLDKKYGEKLFYMAKRDFNPSASVFQNKYVGIVTLSRREKESYKNMNEIDKAEIKAYKLADEEKQKDKNKLFELLAKYIEGWWD